MANVYVSLKIDLSPCGDPLTSHLASSPGQIFNWSFTLVYGYILPKLKTISLWCMYLFIYLFFVLISKDLNGRFSRTKHGFIQWSSIL